MSSLFFKQIFELAFIFTSDLSPQNKILPARKALFLGVSQSLVSVRPLSQHHVLKVTMLSESIVLP